MKKLLKLLLPILAIVIAGLSFNSKNANASSYLNGNTYASRATRYVKTTKKMPVYRVKTGKYEAANHYYKAGSIKKGTKLRISRWIMSLGGVWIVKSKKYYHNSRTFFVVPGMKANWYKKI